MASKIIEDIKELLNIKEVDNYYYEVSLAATARISKEALHNDPLPITAIESIIRDLFEQIKQDRDAAIVRLDVLRGVHKRLI